LIARDVGQQKAFYDLDCQRRDPGVDREQEDLWAPIGAPAEQSTLRPGEEVERLTLFDSWATPDVCERGGFDYLDAAYDHTIRPTLPQSYGGISGSGLWRIPIKRPTVGSISWSHTARLESVAFYQKATHEQQHIIRCHGRKSICRLLPSEGESRPYSSGRPLGGDS
jgi:hypothetical protein